MKTNPSQIQHEQLRRLLIASPVKVRAPQVLSRRVREAWRVFHRKPKE